MPATPDQVVRGAEDTQILSLEDPRVTPLDDLDVQTLARAGARVQARLDRGWPRLVVRSAPMQMTAIVTGAHIVDDRTGTTPVQPAVDRGEADAPVPTALVAALGLLVRAGDKLSVRWVTRHTDPAYAALPPTQRTTATITVHHADGTLDTLGPAPGRYRTAPPGERLI